MATFKHLSSYGADADEEVRKWHRRLDAGLKYREEDEEQWEKNEKFENMRQWDGDLGTDDEVTVNRVGSYIKTYRSRIAFNQPRAKLTPGTSDGWEPIMVPVRGPDGQPKEDPQTGQVMVREVQKYKVREALINDILSKPAAGTQATNGRLVKAGCLAWGVLKSGYEPSFMTDPEPEGEQRVPTKDGALDLSGFMRNPVTGQLEITDGDRLIRRDSVPVNEDFFIRWVPYRNIIVDPDGGNDWSDHRWVAEEWVRPLEDVKSDPLFKNTDDLKANGRRARVDDDELGWMPRERRDWSADGDGKDDDEQFVRGFEIYDLVDERLIVMVDGHGKMLRDDPTPIGIPDHPYSDFRPNEVMGRFFPRPIVTDLVPIAKWSNVAHQMELRAMKRSTRKVLTKKGAINDIDMDALQSDEDMAVVEIDLKGHNALADSIAPFAPPPLSDTVYRGSQIIDSLFDEVGGISEAGRGNSTGGTATETSVVEQYAGARIDMDRKTLAECWRMAIKKLNDSIDENMTVERAVRLEGSDGQAFTALVDRDMIAGDYDVDVDVEDMAPKNDMMEMSNLNTFLNSIGQNIWLVADEVLAREFLDKFGIKNERVVEKVTQMAQQMIQREERRLQAEEARMQVEAQFKQAQAAQMSREENVPGRSPNASPASSQSQAIAQTAAGTQAVSNQGAT